MKKGKTLTLLVLIVEIASITVLHAVKIKQSSKTASNTEISNKEVTRTVTPREHDFSTTAIYSLAIFRY
jgi:hypothetical protein